MDKKYQVFISSTYTDLVEARTAVRDAILSMMHFPVGMELFGAADEEQWQIIQETIDSSDYYVLIVGQRYGSVIADGADAGISYTEKEFRYALQKGVPILAFIINDDVAVKPEHIEKTYPDKLAAFKSAVKDGRLVEWWNSPDDLAKKVTAALYKQMTRTKRPGWIRGDAVDIEGSLRAITELSERNQQLAEENKVLLLENQELKQKASRKPDLFISFTPDEADDDEQDDSLYSRSDRIYTDEEDRVHLKVGNACPTTMIDAEYLPLSKSDFIGELHGRVTDEEIKKYNESLPSKEVLEDYKERYKTYHMIVDHGIAAVLSIHNIGTAKATDVSATIEFPDEIMVLDINDVKDMEEPRAPKKPRDLQQIAYERAHRSELVLEKAYAQLEQMGQMKPVKWPILPAMPVGNTVYESVNISENIVEIETKRHIVHTKYDWFGGIYLVPLQKGEFKVKATLMCSEYEDPEETEIVFICE